MPDETDDGMPFATPDDLAARWRELSAAETSRAGVLLADVSDWIRERSPVWRRLRMERPRLLAKATCDIVRRMMQSDGLSGVPAGVTQVSQTTGSFTDGYTFAQPTGGDMWLRDDEKRLLAIDAQRAFSVDMATGEVR